MGNGGKVLLLTVFVLTVNFGYAQTAKPITPQKVQCDSIKVGAPTVYVGNYTLGGEISIEELLENPFLSVTAKDGAEWKIVSYRVVFVRQINGNGVEDPPITVNGAEYTEQIKSLIKSLPAGTYMEFTEIRLHSSAGTKTLTAPLIVRIR